MERWMLICLRGKIHNCQFTLLRPQGPVRSDLSDFRENISAILCLYLFLVLNWEPGHRVCNIPRVYQCVWTHLRKGTYAGSDEDPKDTNMYCHICTSPCMFLLCCIARIKWNLLFLSRFPQHMLYRPMIYRSAIHLNANSRVTCTMRKDASTPSLESALPQCETCYVQESDRVSIVSMSSTP